MDNEQIIMSVSEGIMSAFEAVTKMSEGYQPPESADEASDPINMMNIMTNKWSAEWELTRIKGIRAALKIADTYLAEMEATAIRRVDVFNSRVKQDL